MYMLPPSAVPHMTSDTAEYCAHLNNELARARGAAAAGAPSPIARRLANEGRHLCDSGLYRAGVMRLRRALSMMREGE